MVAIRNSIIRENIFEHNNGTGYWCDISCLNVDIVRNLSISNKRHGYFYEISSTSIIASNVAADNEGSGIHVMGSNHVDVYNNTLVNNKRNLFVGDENRKNTNPTEIAEGNDWDTHNVKVINNILSGNNGSTDANVDGGSQLLAVANYETGQPTADTFFTTIDYNAYYRANSAIPRDVVAYWTGASGTPAYWLTAETLAEFQAYTQGYEQHGVIVDGNPIHPWFEDVDAGDYHLATGVSLIGAGQPIPSSVANAINSGLGTAIVTAESTIDVGAIQWIEELTVPGDLPEPTPTPTPIPTPTPTPTPVGDRGGATSIQGGTRIQGGTSISGNE